MVSLRADEHRYLVTATGRDEALLQRVPGCRYVASARAYQLARQPGSVLALDHLFGATQWEHTPDLAQEVVESRSRQVTPAQQRAVVSLVGNELAVECAFADKELVKLVPGYRWSAPQRKWFLPAYPMSIELLDVYFADHLEVDEPARRLLDLKRIDEDAQLERAASLPAAVLEAAPVFEETGSAVAPEVAPAPTAAASNAAEPLLERLDRLAGAVEELVALLREGMPAAAVRAEATGALTNVEPEGLAMPVDGAWRELLALAANDPAEALQRIRTPLQMASQDELPTLRAVAGIACSIQADHREALTWFRRAQEFAGASLDAELHQRMASAYLDSVVALVGGTTSPERPVADRAGIEELVLAELVHDSGFVDEGLGSKDSRDLLSLLMDDQLLRRIDPVLTDYCRVLHLVCVARGGRWMAAERVIEMLRHRDLTDAGFALGLIVLANTVFEQPCMDEWIGRWPPEASELGFDDLRAVVEAAVTRLKAIDPAIASAAALSALALASGARIEAASSDERRQLVRLVPPRAGERRYAEFLAAFQPAQTGARKVAQNFPGYLQVLANWPLSQSAPHLLNVFVNDSGGPDSTTRRIAEDVYIPALIARGIRDPRSEVLDLVDMLAESPKADNLLNAVSEHIDDGDIPGSASVSHEQRLELFERTFRVALQAGHDHDSVTAFDRVVRELLQHGEFEKLRRFCLTVPTGFKPLQLPVGQALLSLQLESGEDFEPAAELVLRNCNPRVPADEGTHELKGLGIAFPRFREYLDSHLPAGETLAAGEPDLSGRRVVVVGGHEWLRKHAMPAFDAWGVKTTWLSPDDAKNGAQAKALASGAADLVVINTACISHAASGRVRAEVERAQQTGELKIAYHNSRGLGALLSITREALADSAPPLAGPGTTKAGQRRKMLR
ncbi:MAG: DUF2325 domain-containing protein [Dehalococcoidia bacterium]|jgi:hypothetical protein